jgi:hypothetical protein
VTAKTRDVGVLEQRCRSFLRCRRHAVADVASRQGTDPVHSWKG